MATIPIWEDMALTARYAVLASVWAVIGICWLLIVWSVIAGAGVRKRKLLTAAVFAGSLAALTLTVRESRICETVEPDPPAQKLPAGDGVQHA
jgi:hypothetical protein